ncbi:MAG: DUF1255 family protein [Phycisphaera sp.]|nr:DUF1255 family protein [Phycisphaera sp.]
MSDTHPEKFDGVSVVCKGNVYFDAGVVSHTVLFGDGSRKTLGLIRPGAYRFDTKAPEHIAVTDGACRVKLDGASDFTTYKSGEAFNVPGDSEFDIVVDEGVCQYICTYL